MLSIFAISYIDVVCLRSGLAFDSPLPAVRWSLGVNRIGSALVGEHAWVAVMDNKTQTQGRALRRDVILVERMASGVRSIEHSCGKRCILGLMLWLDND